MHITLNWETNAPQNLSLFDLKISQREGCFAKARLVIDALASLPEIGTHGTLKMGSDEILLRGKLAGPPIKVEGHFSEIELLAKPDDFSQKIEVFQKNNRDHPYWDILYIHPDKINNFDERQDVNTTSIYCDRWTGELSYSNWNHGKQAFNIKENFFKESLQIKKVGNPLKACTVRVHAHWIQKQGGIENISPAIRRAFPRNKVHSFSKNALLDKWPDSGQRLGKSGVWIVKSTLEPVNLPASLYPRYSPQLSLEDDEGHIKPFRVKKHWFKPKLWIGWQAEQKRRETFIFTLQNGQNQEDGEHKYLEYTLQNINPDPNAYPWKPETYYKERAKVLVDRSIYRCKSAHTSSLTFCKDNWTFKKNFHTPLDDPARASF